MGQIQLIAACILLLLFNEFTNFGCAQDCHPLDQCSCKLDDGRVISLWEIDKGNGEGYTVQDALSRDFQYVYSPCTGLKRSGNECDGSLGCQSDNNNYFVFAYKPAAISTAFDSISNNYQFIYKGSSTGLSNERSTTVSLICQQSSTAPQLSSVLEQPTGTYSLSLTSKCACPNGCKQARNTTTTTKSKLSTGSVLCIILLVLLIVYVVGGILINKYARHQEGADIIPNLVFWKDLPFLIKDGTVFAFSKVSGKRSEYNQI